jgi:hypothetical protein
MGPGLRERGAIAVAREIERHPVGYPVDRDPATARGSVQSAANHASRGRDLERRDRERKVFDRLAVPGVPVEIPVRVNASVEDHGWPGSDLRVLRVKPQRTERAARCAPRTRTRVEPRDRRCLRGPRLGDPAVDSGFGSVKFFCARSARPS